MNFVQKCVTSTLISYDIRLSLSGAQNHKHIAFEMATQHTLQWPSTGRYKGKFSSTEVSKQFVASPHHQRVLMSEEQVCPPDKDRRSYQLAGWASWCISPWAGNGPMETGTVLSCPLFHPASPPPHHYLGRLSATTHKQNVLPDNFAIMCTYNFLEIKPFRHCWSQDYIVFWMLLCFG